MRHLARLNRTPIGRYAVMLAVVAAPLLIHYVSTATDDPALQESIFAAGAPSAAPDHALLMVSDVERALPVAPRVTAGSITPSVT